MGKILFVSELLPDVVLSEFLRKFGWGLKHTKPGEFATVMSLEAPDAILLRPTTNMLLLRQHVDVVRNFDDNLPIIVLADKGDVTQAVELVRQGAYDYFTEPLDLERLNTSLTHAVKMYHLTKKVFLLENQMGWRGNFDELIGHSAKMQEIFQLITSVAKSNATVLVTGESGTGKELVARALHRHSARNQKRFIDLNCGAIPRELLENELFGHERGAYTGADRLYIGSCERANGGSLFLDEICEMEPSLQVKILRLLQERSFMRVGGNDNIDVDVRFIAATNRDVMEEVKSGRFREDLYYRLNVVTIHIPALRERSEDVPLLAKHFLEKITRKNEKIFVDIHPDALMCLMNYDWPGNVRELENVIERVVVLYNDTQVKVKHLPLHIQTIKRRTGDGASEPVGLFAANQSIIPLDLIEKYAIEAALQKCVGNVSEAAKKLKIGQATLYRKIRQYGLR
jgi:two-component system response regulator HydG